MFGGRVKCEADDGSKGGAEKTCESHEWDTRKNRVGTAQCGCGRSQAHLACTLPGSPVS